MEEKEGKKEEVIPNITKEKKEKEKKEEKGKEDEKEVVPLVKEDKKLESFNSEEFELKDHYSIDDISYSKLEDTIKNSKRKIYNISQAILIDNLEELKNILEKNESLINKKTMEGFTLIQYAALNGSINCFKYLFSLKSKTEEDIEGFHLIHLSLIKSIFYKNKERCKEVFQYIYINLPEQKKLKDRLGRTYLHLIFELNFSLALDGIDILLDDLFVEDDSGEFALNYIYKFKSEECFFKIAKDNNTLRNIYITARQKNKLSKNIDLCKEEKFLESLFLYRNDNIIQILAVNSQSIFQELYFDLNIIREKYNQLANNEIKNNQYDIFYISKYIDYTLSYLDYNRQSNNSLINNVIMFDFNLKKEFYFTAIVYNKDCINHLKISEKDPIKYHKKRSELFENSDRLSCLINEEEGIIVNNQIFNYKVELKKEPYIFKESERKSCLNDILKCHDIKYIKALKYKCDNISKKNNKEKEKDAIPKFWESIDFNLIEKNYFLYNNNIENEKEDKENPISIYKKDKIDIDTFINQYSYENIFNTTGCVFDAIDLVMEEESILNSFALIRPPGHHSGYYGPVENKYGTSNGYCIVNNIAIGAAYAKYKYHEFIKKIAIIDIDVHHGNGTEEIVEMLNYKNFSKPFNYEKICGVKITEKQNINWLDFDDAKNVLFISTHIYDKNNPDNFYPYSGSDEKNTKKDSEIYPGGIYNIPLENKENYPYEYKNILRGKIIPRLYKFKPDIIFVSAGFDGHKLETINKNHMLLQENDYGYIAQQLQFVANKFCKGKMVCVLEGGYNINTGIISSFAQSVFYFTRFMNIGANMLQCHDVKLTSHKRAMQFNEEMELYNLAINSKKQKTSEKLLKDNNEEKDNKNDNDEKMEEKDVKNNTEENNKKEDIGANDNNLKKE